MFIYVYVCVCVRSERVGKSGISGALLTEAKYINVSLFHLEQVSCSLCVCVCVCACVCV